MATPAKIYFLKRLSKAARASEEFLGAGLEAVGLVDEVASRATVTRASNQLHSLAWSFSGKRAGIGFRHWNRVEGSKWAHCLQQCKAALHFGQTLLKSVPFGRVVAQL
jgi:hypothetical protein